MTYLSDETLEHLREVADVPDLSETRYTIEEELGRGGMGTVYLATDAQLGRQVALKVLTLPDPDAAQRMQQEARILAGLEHPGIVPIHDAGTLPDGRVFYAMKRVHGKRLDELAGLDLSARLGVFERLCEAVAFAHAHGVIHRDLKPENVMVGSFGEVLVMDWGVARLSGEPDAGRRLVEPAPRRDGAAGTRAGSIVGTPGYMAPEQARGEKADERSDVFALGAILSFLLRPEAPPAALSAICRTAMAHDPAARYPSARELAFEVGRYVQGARVHAYRETPWQRAYRVAHRHRAWILLVLAYLVMRSLLLIFRGT